MSYHVLLWHHTIMLAYPNTPPQAMEGPKIIKIPRPRHPHHLLLLLQPFLIFQSSMTQKDNPICNDLYHHSDIGKWNFLFVALVLQTLFTFHMCTPCFHLLFFIYDWHVVTLRPTCLFTYAYLIFTLHFTCVCLKANTPSYLFKPVVRCLYSLAFH